MRLTILLPSALLACVFLSAQLAGHPLSLASSSSRQDSERYRAGNWDLSIRKDRFSEKISCRLRSHDKKIVSFDNALAFRFGRQADVMRAVFRLDEGAIMRWRDVLPELAQLRVPLDGRDMEQPTGGAVWLPVRMLQGVSVVRIQARPNRKPRVFSLAGLEEIQARAQMFGCGTRG